MIVEQSLECGGLTPLCSGAGVAAFCAPRNFKAQSSLRTPKRSASKVPAQPVKYIV